jgi:hypothetical protein
MHGAQRGVLDVHEVIPSVRFPPLSTGDFRSTSLSSLMPMAEIGAAEVIECCRLIGKVFALKEPMTRWFRIPSDAGSALSLVHEDAFSAVQSKMQAWTIEEVHVWLPRLQFLTDLSKPGYPARQDALNVSLASYTKDTNTLNGAVVAYVVHMGPPQETDVDPPVYAAVTAAIKPVCDILTETETNLASARSTLRTAVRCRLARSCRRACWQSQRAVPRKSLLISLSR